tara:strand:+ start:8327 stop:8578 length:252 start_codon:yes stop_codon:yes gene_type:complete
MEITKLSTKGQVVIPEEYRKNLEVGTAFAVAKKDDLIVLKKVDNLSDSEVRELEELQKIWKDIDSGKGESYTKEEFFDELEKW